jgi:hypothetical protein
VIYQSKMFLINVVVVLATMSGTALAQDSELAEPPEGGPEGFGFRAGLTFLFPK